MQVYATDSETGESQECTGPGSAVVQWSEGGVVDVHCAEEVSGDVVRVVSSTEGSTACGLHVNGGIVCV